MGQMGGRQGKGKGRSMMQGRKNGKGQGKGAPNWKMGKVHGNYAKDYKDENLTGKKGAGPSRSMVILDSSSEGFSRRSYRKVFKAYYGITNEDLRNKKVPSTHSQMVKRYFKMIRPR